MSDDSPDDELGSTSSMIEESADGFGGGIADRDTSGTTETTEATETTSTTETTEATDDFKLKRDWNGRTIYLSDDLVDEVDTLFKRADLNWSEDHGGSLAKNEQFYPAIFRVAVENPELVYDALERRERGD